MCDLGNLQEWEKDLLAYAETVRVMPDCIVCHDSVQFEEDYLCANCVDEFSGQGQGR